MAQVTFDLGKLLLTNYKTYIAGLASIVATVFGYFGYVNADAAYNVSYIAMIAAIIFSRMGTAKVSDQVGQILDAMNASNDAAKIDKQ